MDHNRYKTTYRCVRCATEAPTNRLNQTTCRCCRLIENLRYWNEGHTRASKCTSCGARMLRAERSSHLCADCHISPRGWVEDCVCCEGKDLWAFAPGVPACKWCVLDPDVGVRTALTRRLEAFRPGTAQTEPGRRRGKVAVKGSDAAATLRLQIVKVALQKNPTFPRGMDWKQFAVQGQTKRWVAGLDLPPIEPAEPRLRAILEAAIAAPEGWLTRAVK